MANNKLEQLKFSAYDDWPIPTPPKSSVFFDTKISGHIWTETKAQLIRNYLNYFQWVTRHGCYIDGFAGPQYKDEPDSWSARLVLEMTPKFFRNFFLCELNKNSFNTLKSMVNSQPYDKNRNIIIYNGDFNEYIDTILNSGVIGDKTATFALLDQHTAQCKWDTVIKLAEHKKGNTKIELFYFYPTSWIKRSISKKNEDDLDGWWGDDGWKELKVLNQAQSLELMTEKFHNLGYLDVSIWPIYKDRNSGGRLMYHMIHATDHPNAKELMSRAYQKLVATPEQRETIDMWEAEHLNLD